MTAILQRLAEPSSIAGYGLIGTALGSAGSVPWYVTLGSILAGIGAVLRGEGTR